MSSLALMTVLAQQQPGGFNVTSFVPLLLIVAVFYLLLIRPQQRKARQHAELIRSVGVGDRVITIGGLHATVETIDEDTAQLEVAPGVVVTMTRSAIARRLVDADAPGDGDDDAAGPGLDSREAP